MSSAMVLFTTSSARCFTAVRNHIQLEQDRIKASRVGRKRVIGTKGGDALENDTRTRFLSLDRRLFIGVGICSQVFPARAEIGRELKVEDQDPSAQYRYFTTSQVDEIDDRRVFLEVERSLRIQKLNSSPPGFPIFVRIGYNVDIVFEPEDLIEIQENGTMFVDFEKGSGPCPGERQEIEFHYTAYNEQGKVVDSTYRQGRPAIAKLDTTTTLIPGFQSGIKSMKVGGKRRIIVPPELGPPVGPSTFFSSRQFEVFDVQLLQIRSCVEKQNFMVRKLECTEVIA